MKTLLSLVVFTLCTTGYAESQIQTINVGTPNGIKRLSFDSSISKSDVFETYFNRVVLNDADKNYKEGLLTESEIKEILNNEVDSNVRKIILLTLSALRENSIELNLDVETPVSYRVRKFIIPGWTTNGFVSDCWDCGGSLGIREAIGAYLGIQTGHLYHSKTDNPRFVRRAVYRGLATIVRLSFLTKDNGTIMVPVTLEFSDTYHPFVADMPANGATDWTRRVYGTSQRVMIFGGINFSTREYDGGEQERDFVKGLFGSRISIQTSDLYRISIKPAQEVSKLPETFRAVADEPVEGTEAKNLKRKILRDLQGFVKLSNKHLLYRSAYVVDGEQQETQKVWWQLWK